MNMPPDLKEKFVEYAQKLPDADSNVKLCQDFGRLFEETLAAFAAIGKEPHPMPQRMDFLAVDETTLWPPKAP